MRLTNNEKFTVPKQDVDKLIARLKAIDHPSTAVQNFIEAYEINPNVVIQLTAIERKGGGNKQ
jgi:hypothetical protein